MDFYPPHIRWAEDIYQKLEAICSEVEDVNWKEGLQYVEKQLQTVSNNVKKLCSDVVTDVLTTVESFECSTYESSPVVKTDGACEKPKKCVEKCKCGKELSNTSRKCGKELSNTSHLHLSCPMHHVKAMKPDACLEEGADNGICGRSDLILEEKHSEDKELELKKSDDISLDSKNKEPDLENSDDISLDAKNKELVRENSDDINQSKPKLSPTSDDHLENNFSTPTILGDASPSNAVELVVPSGEKLPDSEHGPGDVLTDIESDRESDFGATLVSSSLVKLEESCILVDESEISSVPHETGPERQVSDKKQLKKASDTNRMATTHDHHQKATISDSECSQLQQGFASPSVTTTPVDDDGFSESEWEIV